jgi:hypothetical protein
MTPNWLRGYRIYVVLALIFGIIRWIARATLAEPLAESANDK